MHTIQIVYVLWAPMSKELAGQFIKPSSFYPMACQHATVLWRKEKIKKMLPLVVKLNEGKHAFR